MSTLFSVMSTLQQAVTAATLGTVGFTTTRCAVGWPSLSNLQSIAKSNPTAPLGLASIYDRKVGRNTTRWMPHSYGLTVIEPAIITSVAPPIIAPSGQAVIALSGSVNTGDAVSCVIAKWGGGSVAQAAVVVNGVSDAPTTAAALAAAINADPVLSTWVAASVMGGHVTVTNQLSVVSLAIASYAGNGATQTTEVGRKERQFQIACWAPTETLRQAFTDPIDIMIGQAQNNFGFVQPDGTALRVLYDNDYYCEDDRQADVYRRDFLVRIDYPITVQDQLYAVLAPIPSFSLN